MSYILRGRVESRLAALVPVVAAACALTAILHRWWPVEAAGLMAPPELPRNPNDGGELGKWNKKLNRYFELGTVYTMIAGLLNILAIYDAFAGPVESGEIIEEDEKSTPAGAAA